MNIQLACFKCQNPMTVDSAHGGKTGKCPKCSSTFKIPSIQADPAADAARQALEQRLAEAEVVRKDAESRAGALEGQLAEARSRIAELEAAPSGPSPEEQALGQRAEAAEERARALETQLEESRARIVDLESNAPTLPPAGPTPEQVAALVAAERRATELETQLEETRTRLLDLESEAPTVPPGQLEATASAAVEQVRAEKAEARVAELEAELARIKDQPIEPILTAAPDTTAIERDLVEARRRIDELESEATKADDLEAARREAEAARRERDEAASEVERLRREIAEARTTAAEAAAGAAGAPDAARLAAELEEARSALERTERRLEEERREIASLRARPAASKAPERQILPAGEPLDDQAAVERLGEAYRRLKTEIGKVIVGQEEVVDQLLISVFSRGHCLLIGVPGLAKTMLVSTLARTLNLSFNRIQFTPDLMPSDITGTEVIQEDKASGERRFKFLPGPIFANVVLADEINRTPPKTQAALLEAMQEHQVSAGGTKHLLPEPFFVLATQNPIEQEGTYPLPEAQLDRFMFNVLVDYPDDADEMEIMRRTTADRVVDLATVLTGAEILRLQDIVRRVPVTDDVVRYAMTFARMTRVGPNRPEVPDFIKEWVSWGAGPRASQYLILGAKARAVLDGRFHVTAADVRTVAHPVLRHRILTNFSAEAEGITRDIVIDKLIETIEPQTSKS